MGWELLGFAGSKMTLDCRLMIMPPTGSYFRSPFEPLDMPTKLSSFASQAFDPGQLMITETEPTFVCGIKS